VKRKAGIGLRSLAVGQMSPEAQVQTIVAPISTASSAQQPFKNVAATKAAISEGFECEEPPTRALQTQVDTWCHPGQPSSEKGP
jgi:hypothetical protein